jgi:hypothetical protein
MIAADLAGDTTVLTDDLAGVLLSIIANPTELELLRARAAISLGPTLEMAAEGFDDLEEIAIGEPMFLKIQNTLRSVFQDASTPKEVRRRVLEGSVRAPESWHTEAVREAYASGDQEWLLTAVFSMRWLDGFEEQILASLRNPDPDIQFEAIAAAGEWELDPAWDFVAGLVNDPGTPKHLLLAAIGAVGTIRPAQAMSILADLADSDDEDIAAAADESLMMAEAISNED